MSHLHLLSVHLSSVFSVMTDDWPSGLLHTNQPTHNPSIHLALSTVPSFLCSWFVLSSFVDHAGDKKILKHSCTLYAGMMGQTVQALGMFCVNVGKIT